MSRASSSSERVAWQAQKAHYGDEALFTQDAPVPRLAVVVVVPEPVSVGTRQSRATQRELLVEAEALERRPRNGDTFELLEGDFAGAHTVGLTIEFDGFLYRVAF